MANLIITGSSRIAKKYLEEYIQNHKFKSYEVLYFESSVKIDDARQIKRTLTHSVEGQKVFVFTGVLTIECQNALLKSIEETAENIHFIFYVESLEQLLPTVQSRCAVIALNENAYLDRELYPLVKNLSANKEVFWENIEEISEYVKKSGMTPLVPILRELLLANVEHKSEVVNYHRYCKSLLRLMPLMSTNNVSEKTILEQIFN